MASPRPSTTPWGLQRHARAPPVAAQTRPLPSRSKRLLVAAAAAAPDAGGGVGNQHAQQRRHGFGGGPQQQRFDQGAADPQPEADAQQQQQQQPLAQPEPSADLGALLASSADGISTRQFDSYALRHLVQCPPAETAHLSSLAVTPGRVLRRYAVRGASGERCVMTLTFAYEPRRGGGSGGGGGAQPQERKQQQQQHCDGGGDEDAWEQQQQQEQQQQREEQQQQREQQQQQQPAPAAGGAAAGTWVLAAASGEPAWPDAPLSPAPEHPPEAVVRAQLEALRDLDALTAWRFVAPRARPALGGCMERFSTALEAPALRPLLMHGEEVVSVMRRQRGGDSYSEVVRLETISGDWCDYCFTLRLQRDGGPFDCCWMTESISPVGPRGCSGPADCGSGGEEACGVPDDWAGL